jgi:hypothetical protein
MQTSSGTPAMFKRIDAPASDGGYWLSFGRQGTLLEHEQGAESTFCHALDLVLAIQGPLCGTESRNLWGRRGSIAPVGLNELDLGGLRRRLRPARDALRRMHWTRRESNPIIPAAQAMTGGAEGVAQP